MYSPDSCSIYHPRHACESGEAVRVSVCQLPDDLSLGHPAWADFVRRIERERADLAVLNEMPFGAWLAGAATFDERLATGAIDAHEHALQALRHLPIATIGSRPVRAARKLANEAFLMVDGEYRSLHHKQYFPQEDGFFEETWFAASRQGFEVTEFHELRIGVLLCSELMFTEWARHYRRQGAHLIVAPRASSTSMRCWDAAARMAAIVSGCYVLSSNRVSRATAPAPRFGGRGFIYSPSGELVGETTAATPVVSANIDVALVAEAQRSYPCYLRELQA